jgi:hypothetical protein
MSRPLTVELSEEAFTALERSARVAARSPAELAAAALEQQFGVTDGKHQATEAERQAARLRFERHFGAVDLGHPTGVDNEDIDADLARAYGDDHKES